MVGAAKEVQSSCPFWSHSTCSFRLTLQNSCEDDTGDSAVHNSQDVESSVVSFDMDRENVSCRDGPVSEALAAQHEDMLPGSQVKLIGVVNACL